MPAILRRLPNITITEAGSAFALSGTAGSITANSITVTQSAFTVYGAAFPSPSSEPTAAAIEAGTGAVATASGNAIASLSFTGLSASTSYDFYVVGKDASGEYTRITKITANTSSSSGGEITINLSGDFSLSDSSVFAGIL